MIKIIFALVMAFGSSFSFAQPQRWQYIDYPPEAAELFACKCSRRYKSSDMDCRCIPDYEEKRRRSEEASQIAQWKEQKRIEEEQRKQASAERAAKWGSSKDKPKEFWRWRGTDPDQYEQAWIDKAKSIKNLKE